MANLKLRIKKAKLKRKINGVLTEGYYGRVVSNGVKDYEDLVKSASKHTTIHKSEMKLAADLILEEANDWVKQGYIVDLGPLGKIYPSVNGVWHADPDDVLLKEMSPKINYRPSDDIKSAIEGAKLGWVSISDDDEEDENSDTPSSGDNNGNTPDPDENILG